MTEIGLQATRGNRIYFLDNLRTFMIFLVVVLHSGLVYEGGVFSSMFWIVYDPSTNELAGVLRIIMDIFVMSTIFFISGYLTPQSLKRKSGRTFLKSKFKRLIFPWIIAVLTLVPLYKIIYLYSRHLPQQDWTTYFHWSNQMWGQNWLWFLPVLFLFDLLYLALSKTNIKLPDISLKTAVGVVFLIGFASSAWMDAMGWMGWTKTWLMDFQNERLLIYALMFLLGTQCYRLKIFEPAPTNKRLFATVLCTVWLPVYVYHLFYLESVTNPAGVRITEMIDTLVLWSSFHLSLLGLLYLMINSFRMYLDRSNAGSRVLSTYSYHIYIIHVVVMGGLAMIMMNTAMPSLLRYLILSVSTFGVSILLIYCYRKTIQLINLFLETRSMKTLTTVLLLVTLVAVTGCGRDENSSAQTGQVSASQATPEPPSLGLHEAAIFGNLEAVQQHIAAGSDLNVKEPTRLSTPLITATVFGKTEIAVALIEAGADIDYQNNEGSTALITAALFCRTEIVRSLLDNGAEKTLTNGNGRIALDTVAGPFEDVKGIYDGIGAALAPLGLVLDYDRIRATRPVIAEMLR